MHPEIERLTKLYNDSPTRFLVELATLMDSVRRGQATLGSAKADFQLCTATIPFQDLFGRRDIANRIGQLESACVTRIPIMITNTVKWNQGEAGCFSMPSPKSRNVSTFVIPTGPAKYDLQSLWIPAERHLIGEAHLQPQAVCGWKQIEGPVCVSAHELICGDPVSRYSALSPECRRAFDRPPTGNYITIRTGDQIQYPGMESLLALARTGLTPEELLEREAKDLYEKRVALLHRIERADREGSDDLVGLLRDAKTLGVDQLRKEVESTIRSGIKIDPHAYLTNLYSSGGLVEE